jgi:hypothetical protein
MVTRSPSVRVDTDSIFLLCFLSFPAELLVWYLFSKSVTRLFRRICKRHISDSVLLFRRHIAVLVFVDHVDVLLVLFLDGYEQS